MKNQKKNLLFVSFIMCIIIFSGFSDNHLNQKLSGSLRSLLLNDQGNEKILVWIFFKDKGINDEALLRQPELYLTSRSIERRFKKSINSNITDVNDLPVNKNYINDIKSEEINIKQVSKWFNGISCYIERSKIPGIAIKEYVKQIDLVARFRKDHDPANEEGLIQNNFNLSLSGSNTINYGPSLNQSQIISVPEVHNKGYHGQGILIASFDAGFDNLSHPCFSSMMQRGVRTYDFVNGDTIVADGPGRPGSGAHGTLTLSQVAGFAEGNLVSPAFGSNYILAKTENTESETPIEEDNWIAAAEWADSLGADIITSSLGYLGFDPPYPSYDYTWMSGDSTRITKGANIAVEKGIIVVNSAGNSGFNPQRNTLSAPADGFYVLTVGAVNPNGIRAGYSSVGPTFLTNRIKPDVMAQGTGNICAMPGEGNTGYISSASGTSLSTPMVAGVCALILNANPDLNPFQVMGILRGNASNSGNPDNLIGWGTVNAYLSVLEAERLGENVVSDFSLFQNYPNPFNPETIIKFNMNKPGTVLLNLYDVSGRLAGSLINNQSYGIGIHNYTFSTQSSFLLATGVYFYMLIVNGQKIDAKKMVFLK